MRASHEDAWRQRGHVFMVADGMGAHAVGELASKMACDLIPHTYMKTRAGTPSEAIVKAFREVSALIHSRASANRDFQGMGTTCSALILLPEGALDRPRGDSRVYRIRRNRIDQFSFDHSLVWELVRRNHLTSEQASLAFPRTSSPAAWGRKPTSRSTSRGRWPSKSATFSCFALTVFPGRSTIMRSARSPQTSIPVTRAAILISLANLRGGLDNITVQIVRIGPWIDPDSAESQNHGPRESGNGTADRAAASDRAWPACSSRTAALRQSQATRNIPIARPSARSTMP